MMARNRLYTSTAPSAGSVPEFASVAAMNAAEAAGELYGEKIGSVGAQIYQIQANGLARELNVPVWTPVPRPAAALPQSTSTAYYTVSGGVCWVMPLILEVTTVIETLADNEAKLTNNGEDMCAVADISAAAVGTVLGITGEQADALVITATGAGKGQGAPAEAHPGTIEFSCSKSATGEASAVLHYMSLNGGTITATAV